VININLKIAYHYTNFIYPFLISQNRYKDFIGKFIGDGANWKLSTGDDQVDLSTHAYFLPYVKRFLFPTVYWSQSYIEQYEKLSFKKKLDIISRLSCINLEYNIERDNTTNYTFSKTGINFEIQRIGLICFESGICFLVIKTQLDKEDGINSYDILDFNHKFRTINPRYLKKKKTEGIFLKNQEFKGVENLSGFIDDLLRGYEDEEKENIYFDRLFTYSYMCLDEKEWNEEKELDEIVNEFYKLQYVLPGEYGSTFDPDFKGVKDNTYTRWKYSIYGFSRESGVVFASERERFNSTKLPNYFERMYFYVFILAFYQRISLILFSQELMTRGKKKVEELKNRFTKFTHFSWFSQITNSEQGMDLWKKWQKAFDLPELFDEVQKEYGEFYDYTVTKGQEKINLLLIVIYTVSVLFTGMALMVDFKIINTGDKWAKVFLITMLAMTIAVYPLYALIKWARHLNFRRGRKKFEK